MLVMFLAWKLVKRTRFVKLEEVDLVTDTYVREEGEERRWWRAVVNWIV
jgi:AAT family amino acid transporter